MTVRLVTLKDVFPNRDRVTLYRWRKAGKVPPPDMKVGGVSYYREDRFAKPPADESDTAAKAKNTATSSA